MYAIKNLGNGLFYTGKKPPDQKWGLRCDAKWMHSRLAAKSAIGGLRNNPMFHGQSMRVVSIND